MKARSRQGFLLLVRHGLSLWNLEGKLRGRSNVGLSPEGFDQARSLSRFMRQMDLVRIYSSPLLRARQTADIIAAPHGLRVIIDDKLTGVDVGSCEGKRLTQILAKVRNPYNLNRYDSGESFASLMKRMGSTIEMIKRTTEGSALIVSHGDPIAAGLCKVFRLSHEKIGYFHPEPGSISAISFRSNEPRLALFNYFPNIKSLPFLEKHTH
jgi:broad specificity phosphatase PhoE